MKPLILISDGGRLRKDACLVDVISKALKGASGQVEFVVLREQLIGSEYLPAKDADLIELAKQINQRCFEHGAKLILHSNSELYISNKGIFSGIHLNKYSNLELEKSSDGITGYSTHTIQECLIAQRAALDYVFLSPVFPPNSKESSFVLGIEKFAEIKSQLSIPVIALGGIGIENTKDCVKAGADAIAVIGSVLYSEDPAKAAEKIVEEFYKFN